MNPSPLPEKTAELLKLRRVPDMFCCFDLEEKKKREKEIALKRVENKVCR